MSEAVHMRELIVDIEPLGPTAEELFLTSTRTEELIAATIIGLGAREIIALAQCLKDRARPPVEMGIDDVHQGSPTIGHATKGARSWNIIVRIEPGPGQQTRKGLRFRQQWVELTRLAGRFVVLRLVLRSQSVLRACIPRRPDPLTSPTIPSRPIISTTRFISSRRDRTPPTGQMARAESISIMGLCRICS